MKEKRLVKPTHQRLSQPALVAAVRALAKRVANHATLLIKVICPGCNSCRTTAKLIREVAVARHVQITLEEINDPSDIAALGITRTPAVMINGKVVLAGGVPEWIDVENWLTSSLT